MTIPPEAAPMREDVTQADREAGDALCRKAVAAIKALRSNIEFEAYSSTFPKALRFLFRYSTDRQSAADAIDDAFTELDRLAHTARPDAGDSNRKALIEIANMIPGCFAKDGVTDELLALIPAEVRAWTEKLSSRPDAGDEEISQQGYEGGYEWYRNKWIGDHPGMIADLVRGFVPRAAVLPDAGDEVERVALARLLCADARARAIAFQEDAPAFEDSDDEVQEYWLAIADAALSAMREGVDRGMVERTEVQAVWRCAIGDMVGAMDILKKQWLDSKRKAERQAGEALSGVLDLVWAYRDPAPSSYEQANENGKALADRVRAALSGKVEP